ncbi:MAG: type II 3-dehydroquinate dehydratase [Gammaproteobacteria bacterium]|nr:type II 3-dehydroquinate dehydratase [Gammaproteobacteria bacterium]
MNKQTLLILNGPGVANAVDRPGDATLEQIRQACASSCKALGMKLDFRHTDDAGELLSLVAKASATTSAVKSYAGLIINPASGPKAKSIDAASYQAALERAATAQLPIIEVHIENIFDDSVENADAARRLQASAAGIGFISGLGEFGYQLAIKALHHRLSPGDDAHG